MGRFISAIVYDGSVAGGENESGAFVEYGAEKGTATVLRVKHDAPEWGARESDV